MIPYIDLFRRNHPYKSLCLQALEESIDSSDFILGNNLKAFETNFSRYLGIENTVGVANGTDALILCLKCLGISVNDEVITTPKTYLASASSIHLVGAKPVFVDIGDDYNLCPDSLLKSITNKTKAVILVHLAGNPAKEKIIADICHAHNLLLISDCAQAAGSFIDGHHVGSFSDFSTYSFHPLKNLSCIGDGGLIATSNSDYADWLRLARNHGHISRDDSAFFSINSRLDSFQAAILNHKLKYLDSMIENRRRIAGIYKSILSKDFIFQEINLNCTHSYHILFMEVPSKQPLIDQCCKNGLELKDHYPLLVPQMTCFNYFDSSFIARQLPNALRINSRTVSLPVGEYLTDDEVYLSASTLLQSYQQIY